MDYKGLKICKILEPTFMEDNKVFKVNDVCLGYEANNNIVIVSGDYAGNISSSKISGISKEYGSITPFS